MSQKFHMGDHVRVAKDLGSAMRHFQGDCEAIVIGSYVDQYGCPSERNYKIYTLHIKDRGQVSWYDEWQLTLIESNRCDLLKQWKDDQDVERKQKADIDWIFENGPDVVQVTHGASLATLAKCMGINDLWGSHGEGVAYYQNAMRVMFFAKSFLMNKDKAGWLKMCEAIQLPTIDYKVS